MFGVGFQDFMPVASLGAAFGKLGAYGLTFLKRVDWD